MEEQHSMIELQGIIKRFYIGQPNELEILHGIDLKVNRGEFVSVVGSSGSGKTTMMNIIGILDRPTEGEYMLDGVDVAHAKDRDLSMIRNKKIGFVFQTYNLISRTSALKNVELPMLYAGIGKKERTERAKELLNMVGMGERMSHTPDELSGGQKQRVGIARALALNPEFIVCDEITASLDVSVQAQILNLLLDIKEERGMTYLFISHNLDIVKGMCDEVIIMYKGCIVEKAKSEELFEQPKHPYTELLLKSLPAAYPDQKKTGYETKQIIMNAEGQGCLFASRCKYAKKECRERVPQMKEIGKEHWVACHQAVQMTN